MKKYYKLLTKRPDGRLASYLTKDLRSRWAVLYEPKVWTSPKTGKIFIFTSLRAAQTFRMGWQSQPIWLCQAKGVEWVPSDFPRSTISDEWLRTWELFNLGEIREKYSQNDHHFPWGTVLADSIKLIEQVYP